MDYCEVCGAITAGKCDVTKEIGGVVKVCLECYENGMFDKWLKEKQNEKSKT